jgi:hypothetical protein
MSTSLDGFAAGPNERIFIRGVDVDADGIDAATDSIRRSGTVNGRVIDELMPTGAVVAGRRNTFEPAGGWGGDHNDGMPISRRRRMTSIQPEL